MSKLLKIKEWFTIPEAAQHLTSLCGENVTEADVLRIGLDGHLKLSVHFVNGTKVRCGKVVRRSKAELEAAIRAGGSANGLTWITFPPELTATEPLLPLEARGRTVFYLMNQQIGDDQFVELGEKINTIDGIWDLAMVGSERLQVEQRYQMLTGGPDVAIGNLKGAFVEEQGGSICQLQESFEENEYRWGTVAQLERLEKDIADQNLGEEEVERLLKQYEEERKILLDERSTRPVFENYSPADLPNDSVLGIRTAALIEFEKFLNAATGVASNAEAGTEVNTKIKTPEAEKPIATRQRNTLLLIIAALCKRGEVDYLKPSRAAQKIQAQADSMGINIGETTIEEYLKKIPDALQSRTR